jgi:hypothetical protein
MHLADTCVTLLKNYTMNPMKDVISEVPGSILQVSITKRSLPVSSTAKAAFCDGRTEIASGLTQ